MTRSGLSTHKRYDTSRAHHSATSLHASAMPSAGWLLGCNHHTQIQVLWLGRDQFDACAYDLAETESILENFEIPLTNVVLSVA